MLYMEIFNRSYIDRYPMQGFTSPRHLDYLRRTYDYNKSLVVNYYLTRNFAVKNNHILSRYTHNLPVMLDVDPYVYMSAAEDRVDSLTRLFEFTSPFTNGISHRPDIYGNGGSELILSHSPWVNPEKIINSWETFSCIETVTHQRNDMSMLLPFGHDDGSKSGLSAVSLNGVALSYKYREFEREQSRKRKNRSVGPILTKNNFVSKYVIPGIINTHLDHCLLNRIIDTFYDNEIITPKHKVNVPIRDPQTQVDIFIGDVLDNITSKKMDFVNILNNIPLIHNSSAAKLLAFDSPPNVRQSNWFFFSTRLKYMSFLIDVARDLSPSKNFIEDWKRLITRMERDSNIRNEFSYDIHTELMGYIENIKSA